MLPISVLIVTKNEEARIARCLESLGQSFGQVIVIDSGSGDATQEIARKAGAEVVSFHWNGLYPKKRQWCLETLPLRHEWVFFLDADEEATPGFLEELERIDWPGVDEAGFFVSACYVFGSRVLRHGLRNNKLCLLHRGRMEFPPVDDLDIPGMGEIEGHYQPTLKAGFEGACIGFLKAPILHYALADGPAWEERHKRYARWEAGMDAKGAWPHDPVPARAALKRVFKTLPFRPEAAFLHSYILKAGFLDGRAGLMLALSRWRYYRMIAVQRRLKNL
jgi:glycosyltransferase involved in cell wall biosynthesis